MFKIRLKSWIYFKKQILKEIKEIPTAYLCDETETNGKCYHFLVLDLLGPSLKDIYEKKQSFSAKAVFQIGLEMIHIVEKVYKKGILHW